MAFLFASSLKNRIGLVRADRSRFRGVVRRTRTPLCITDLPNPASISSQQRCYYLAYLLALLLTDIRQPDVLSLPSKPWKKVKITALSEQCYRIAFLTEMSSEAALREAVEKDITPSLGARDELGQVDWPSRSVTLMTLDLPTFKRNLVFACVMDEIQ